MHIAGSSKVKDKDGLWRTVVPGGPPLHSNTAQVVVQTENGQQFLVPTELLVQQPDGSYSLPLRLAELEVQKRPVETGKVRITKVVHERETTVDEPLWHDDVAITRVPIQRAVEGPVPVREENDTTIISVVEEVLVVEKRWMLREEIHIRKQRIETHQPQRITLRSEEVQVERVPQADEYK